MALDANALESICRRGFGPLSLVADGAGWTATFEGGRAAIALEGPTVRARSSVPIEWPTGSLPRAEIDTRVDIALRALAMSRNELCTIRANDSHRAVDATAWIDATTASPLELAQLVRLTTSLSAAAAMIVAQVRVGLAAEERAAAAAQAIADDVERARQMLGVDDAAAVSGPPSAPPSAPPAAATAPASAPPSALPAPPPAPPAPPAAPTSPGPFTPTHVTSQGTRTWPAPDTTQPEGPALPGGIPVQLLERRNEWAHVRCSNDWTAWIDARALGNR
jgi:hypothetical protein